MVTSWDMEDPIDGGSQLTPSPLLPSHLLHPGPTAARRGRAGTGSAWLTLGPGLHGAAEGRHQGNKSMGDPR